MAILLAATATAWLVLAVERSWLPPSWSAWLPATDEPAGAPEAWDDDEQLERGLLTAASVRRRLDALTEELDRLDRDREAFARAFHVRVARSAHEALLAAAADLRDAPLPPERPGVGWVTTAPTPGSLGPGTRRSHEELQL